MSKLIGETWEEEVRRRTNQTTLREILRTILEDRFGTLPGAILQQIDSSQDVDRLKAWTRQAARVKSLEELRLE